MLYQNFINFLMQTLAGLTHIAQQQQQQQQSVSKTQWTQVSDPSNFPSNALLITIRSQPYYFCEVLVDAKNSYVTGTMKKGASYCEYELDGAYKKSATFNVLTKQSEFAHSWKYSDTDPPAKAVKCNEGYNCYLGQSVYGDGICQELPGKIFKGKSSMIMVKNGDVYKCPFKLYLVE